VVRAINEMLVSSPNDGSYIELFPYFPANESAAFTTLRVKGGWLVTASKARATAAELAVGGRGVVTGVKIVATVGGTVQLISPWPWPTQTAAAGGALPSATVSCHPAPVAPAVRRVRIGGRGGLAWAMAAAQACSVIDG
jgi:hypothetical protein